jgi:gamma-glutamylputrescine oxidase
VLPALEGEVTCDIAVVGGGLGGMATALRLVERGADVVLLEAKFCGYGANSRNAGQLTGAPAGDPQLLARCIRAVSAASSVSPSERSTLPRN